MADKEIKVHDRVICMIFSMIQRAKNDRSLQRALPVYDNGFAPGHFARFHVRPESCRITVATSPHAISPNK